MANNILIIFIAVMVVLSGGIITPYNTGNDPIYCGFGESKDNCISDIPQGVKIHKNHITHIS